MGVLQAGYWSCNLKLLSVYLPSSMLPTASAVMTMGPAVSDPEELRKYFRLTKNLFDKLNSRYGFGNEPTLSMGMSDSYRVAIEEGSTLVRVGRRLFIK